MYKRKTLKMNTAKIMLEMFLYTHNFRFSTNSQKTSDDRKIIIEIGDIILNIIAYVFCVDDVPDDLIYFRNFYVLEKYIPKCELNSQVSEFLVGVCGKFFDNLKEITRFLVTLRILTETTPQSLFNLTQRKILYSGDTSYSLGLPREIEESLSAKKRIIKFLKKNNSKIYSRNAFEELQRATREFLE